MIHSIIDSSAFVLKYLCYIHLCIEFQIFIIFLKILIGVKHETGDTETSNKLINIVRGTPPHNIKMQISYNVVI